MTTAEAYRIAGERARLHERSSQAGKAWRALSRRRRSRVASPWCFRVALDDARADGGDDLAMAAHTIAASHIGMCERNGTRHAQQLARGIKDAVTRKGMVIPEDPPPW